MSDKMGRDKFIPMGFVLGLLLAYEKPDSFSFCRFALLLLVIGLWIGSIQQ
jgi:FtsH-binding integral membrane protein